MVSHKEFTTAGKKPGLQVWRIENLDLKPIPEALRGSFYTGDAYLLLYTTAAPSYSIHMWLGRHTHALRETILYFLLFLMSLLQGCAFIALVSAALERPRVCVCVCWGASAVCW